MGYVGPISVSIINGMLVPHLLWVWASFPISKASNRLQFHPEGKHPVLDGQSAGLFLVSDLSEITHINKGTGPLLVIGWFI